MSFSAGKFLSHIAVDAVLENYCSDCHFRRQSHHITVLPLPSATLLIFAGYEHARSRLVAEVSGWPWQALSEPRVLWAGAVCKEGRVPGASLISS